MKWCEGSISEAIQLAKTRRTVFVVYIYDESEASTKLNESFNDAAVDEMCVSSNSVAIRLEVKSEAGVQFSQIYPVVIVPCLFFIGNNGIPLEVVIEYITPAELLQKFSHAVELHRSSLAAAPTASPTPAAAASALAAPAVAASNYPESSGSSAVAAAAADAVSDPVPGPSGTTSEFDPDDDGSSAGSTKETLEQKKEKALQLLAKKREDKAREEEEKEKQREVERRKLGQDMVKLKQLKEDRERREIENSYKKKKEEDRLARERVLADLERDRQERALRYRQEKVDTEVAVMKVKSEKLAAQAEEEARQLAAKRESARIQFRLPDGSSVMQVFSSSEPLASCQTFILQRLGWRKVTLSTIYPKRTFTEADMSQTLLDLELAPSAALVVLPPSSDKPSRGDDGGGGGVMAFIWMLLAPLLALWALISNFLFAAPPQAVGATNATPAQSTSSRAPPAGSAPQDSDEPSTSARRRTTGTGSDGLKRHQDGNIRRFTAADDEDENATWNGNSTQQM